MKEIVTLYSFMSDSPITTIIIFYFLIEGIRSMVSDICTAYKEVKAADRLEAKENCEEKQ